MILTRLLVALSLVAVPAGAAERVMVLTFDDLPAQRAQSLPVERIAEINEKLVDLMANRRIPAIGFINENKLEVEARIDPQRVTFLESWLDSGLELGDADPYLIGNVAVPRLIDAVIEYPS